MFSWNDENFIRNSSRRKEWTTHLKHSIRQLLLLWYHWNTKTKGKQSRIIHFLVIGALLLIVHLPLNLVFWYVHCGAMVMRDLNIRSIQCTVMCPALYSVHGLIDVVVVVVIIASSSSMPYTLYCSYCYSMRIVFDVNEEKTHTHTHIEHYTSRSR